MHGLVEVVARLPPGSTIAVAASEVLSLQSRRHTAFLGARAPAPAPAGFRLRDFFSTAHHRSFPPLRLPDEQVRPGGERKRQCVDLGVFSPPGDPELMSRTTPPSDSTSKFTGQSQGQGPRPDQSRADARSTPSHPGSEQLPSPVAMGLPTSASAAGTASTAIETRPIRSLDVQDMLNPTQPAPLAPPPTLQSGEKRTFSLLIKPAGAHHPGPSRETGGVPSQEVRGSPSLRGSQGGPAGQGTRRILRPKSPALRAPGLGRLSLPGNIESQPLPSLPMPGRRFAADPSTSQDPDMPPVPTPPAIPLFSGSYGFPPTTATPPQARRASLGPLSGTLSQSTSPSTSYSSYSQAGRTSPPPRAGLTVMPPSAWPYPAPPLHGAGPGESAPSTPLPFSTSFRPSAYALAQGSQQMLTLDTGQGPIQVPVDVQAASKMADDKRKRNAGASARFRQRRKEKEREASQTISRLEQQIKDLTEEKEFYRNERDHFRQVAAATPGHPPLEPRPLSPAHRRSALSESAPPPEGGGSWMESSVEGEAEARSRRRSSTFASRPMYPLPFPVSTNPAGSLRSAARPSFSGGPPPPGPTPVSSSGASADPAAAPR